VGKISVLRIYLAQINPTVGDIKENYDKITSHIREAKKGCSDIAIFPELSITGYPPEDLLYKNSFIGENIEYINKLKKLTSNIIVIVGFVNRKNNGIYNSAAVIYKNQIKYIYNKQFLPNYSVFDEERYFKKGHDSCVLKIGDFISGINICEDLFYPEGPSRIQSILGEAGLIINISASPYHTGKIKERMTVLTDTAVGNRVNIAYLNMIGGQDELVFDGNSLIMNEKGKVLARAKSFTEDALIYDFKSEEIKSLKSKYKKQIEKDKVKLLKEYSPPALIDLMYGQDNEKKKILKYKNTAGPSRHIITAEEEIFDALILGTRDYVKKNRFEKVIIALSGGIDSVLTAVIAALALGKENVNALLMPSPYSSKGSIDDSVQLCANLGIKYIIISIADIYKSYLKNLNKILNASEINVTMENLQARIRGNITMALANENHWMVLSTGNKSEISVGYCTLYGDMAGGFSPIKDIYKTMVYRISKFVNKKYSNLIPESTITKVPSAELRPDQKDEDTLPPYEILDPILKAYIEDDLDFKSIVQKGFDEKTARKIINMVDSSEYKRRQGSPGIKITPRAFGKDRRYPITNGFRQY